MALGSTQPLTEMSTRNLPGGKGRRDCLEEIWEPRRLTNLWVSTACYMDNFTFFFSSKYTVPIMATDININNHLIQFTSII
jgi:hypothetical protein